MSWSTHHFLGQGLQMRSAGLIVSRWIYRTSLCMVVLSAAWCKCMCFLLRCRVHPPMVAVGSDDSNPSGGGKVQIFEYNEHTRYLELKCAEYWPKVYNLFMCLYLKWISAPDLDLSESCTMPHYSEVYFCSPFWYSGFLCSWTVSLSQYSECSSRCAIKLNLEHQWGGCHSCLLAEPYIIRRLALLSAISENGPK